MFLHLRVGVKVLSGQCCWMLWWLLGVELNIALRVGEYFHVHVLTQGPVHRDLTLEWVSCTHELVRSCKCN